jgi:MFS family permease
MRTAAAIRRRGQIIKGVAKQDAAVAMTVTFTLLGVIVGSWASRVPAVKAATHLSTLELGIALFGLAGGAVIAMPSVGWLAGRVGSDRVTRAGVAMCCLALPVTALAADLPALAAALVALGASVGTLDVGMNTYAVQVEQRLQKRWLSSFHAAFSVGGMLGAAVGAAAAGLHISPLGQFAAVAATCGGCWYATARPRLQSSPRASSPHKDGRGASARARFPTQLLLLGVIAFCALFAEGATADWSAVYLRGSVGASAAAGAAGYAGFSLAMTLSRLMGDRTTERLGPVRITRFGALLAAGGLGLALVLHTPAAGILGFVCLGAGLAPIVPNVFRAAGHAGEDSPGLGIATGTTVGYMGFMLGPPLIGGVAQEAGLSRALGLVVVAGVVMAALAGVTELPEPAASRVPDHAPAGARRAGHALDAETFASQPGDR